MDIVKSIDIDIDININLVSLTADELIVAVNTLEPTLSAYCLRSNQKSLQGFQSISNATITNWVFFSNIKFNHELESCVAGGMIISHEHYLAYADMIHCENIIICQYPYAFFAVAAQIFEQRLQQVPLTNILTSINPHNIHNIKTQPDEYHATAQIHPSAKLGNNISIGAFVVIAADVQIGDNCYIDAHCVIGQSARIGNNTVLKSHVSLYHGVSIGRNVLIHSGTVIGSDGFGFAPYQKRWLKIPQTGGVIIGDDVEIGANCTIDRGALGNTIIGHGTKLDNLIQIAHNVKIGEHCIFASGVGIAGSAILGNRIQVGGKAGILGHLSICDDVVISSYTLVTKTINKVGFYTGVYPIQDNAEWEKNAVLLKNLSKFREQIKKLQNKLNINNINNIK